MGSLDPHLGHFMRKNPANNYPAGGGALLNGIGPASDTLVEGWIPSTLVIIAAKEQHDQERREC